MATLTPAEYEYATTLDWEKLPNRLRCAVCNKAVVEAMKTDCCDTTICGPCASKLSGNCPVCEHKISPDMTREDKRTRTTLKAHIKGELQKRNNAAAAAAKEAEASQPTPEIEQASVTRPAVEVPEQQEQKEEKPDTSGTEQTAQQRDVVQPDVQVATEEQGADGEDFEDDHDNIEIITERPDQDHQQGFAKTPDAQNVPNEQDSGEQGSLEEVTQQYQQDGQQNMGFDNQQGFNMNFGAMGGFNPMMAMPPGMGMPPFGMMPNMMGMPGMAMDPSMMFNGGFAGMANMMNGNMMNGSFGPGMGDMNDFNPYNHQYGNRFDNRAHGQHFSQSNRGYGRGYGHNQNFRGRGQGYFRGRGRGGWQQQQQQHQQHQEQSYQHSNQHGYQRDYPTHEDYNAVESNHDPSTHDQEIDNGTEQSNGHETGQNGTYDTPAEQADPQQHDKLNVMNTVSSGSPSTDVDVSKAHANPAEDEHSHYQEGADDVHDNAQAEPTSIVNDRNTSYDNNGSEPPANDYTEASSAPTAAAVAPPVNAPTGPRAMRAGLPNSGRYSRPQAVSQSGRPASRDSAVPFNPPTGPSADRRREPESQNQNHSRDEQEIKDRRTGRSHSRSQSRHGNKHKRHRSRSPGKEYDNEDKYSREDRDKEDKHRRRDRRRGREEGKEHYEKKQSRSASPDDDDDDSHRRHRHRDEKDRSRRDRSRDKHRESHRSRDKDKNRDDDDYERRKSKSHRSRRDREDKYEDDHADLEPPQKQTSRQARPILEEPQDDIGFKIKGTKSGKTATATTTSRGDPYAEERERMKAQRLQRDAERRQGAHTTGKRGREEANGTDDYASKKKRSKPRARYEGEIQDHEQEREKNRWR